MRIPLANAKKKLTIVWFSGSGILFLLVLLQTIFGKFPTDKAGDAWSWLLPTFMPTLLMIVGVLVADSKNHNQDFSELPTADQFVFRLSFSLSIAYLLTAILTILLGPFFEQVNAKEEKTILDLMKMSNLWLAPFQGLVSASLGAFFVSKK